jgi:hypothetical protein
MVARGLSASPSFLECRGACMRTAARLSRHCSRKRGRVTADGVGKAEIFSLLHCNNISA